jgi:hypothetical protein
MTTLKNTKENNAKVSALKTIRQTKWVGETTHDTLDKALTAINLFQGMNSGWYTPKAVRLPGVQGIFMVNEDGSLHAESRVIKLEDKVYRIEHLSNSGYKEFEEKFFEVLEA